MIQKLLFLKLTNIALDVGAKHSIWLNNFGFAGLKNIYRHCKCVTNGKGHKKTFKGMILSLFATKTLREVVGLLGE